MQHKESIVETFGVALALVGLTFLMAGTVSFAVAGTWLNSFSVMLVPVGAIMLAGSAFIMWRLAAVLMLPAGIVGVSIGLIGLSGLPENAPRLPYVMPIIIGGVFVVISILLNLPALLRRPSKRKGLIGANVAVMCLAGLALLVVTNYAGTLWYTRRDLTASGIHTLSSKTLEILKNLDEPVTATLIMPQRSEEEIVQKVFDFSRDVLLEYARNSKNGQLNVQFIDTLNDPQRFEEFFKKAGAGQQAESVVFQSSHGFRQIMPYELIDQVAIQRDKKLVYTGETKFTSALLHVTDERVPVIYFTTGKGELPLADDPSGQRQPTMSLLARRIREDNYELRTIDLSVEKEVPGDCEILAIVGPMYSFKKAEVDRVRAYLGRGGKLFAALAPELPGVEPNEELQKLLVEWGIRPRTGLTAWAKQLVTHRNMYFFRVTHPAHEATRRLVAQSHFPLYVSYALEAVKPPTGPDGRPLPVGYAAAPIAQTVGESWAGKTASETEIQGPVILAMASQRVKQDTEGVAFSAEADTGEGEARVIAVGSNMLLSDLVVESFAESRDFLLNCINWLAHRTERLGIGSKTLRGEPVKIDPREKDAIFYGTLFGLPYIVLLIGGIVYWRRSR